MLVRTLLVVGLLLTTPWAAAQDEIFGLGTLATTGRPAQAAGFRYPEAKSGPAELRYRDGIPVLEVYGTPDEIGKQSAELAIKAAPRLVEYPKDCLRALGLDFAWPTIVGMGKRMLPNFPEPYSDELASLTKHSGLNGDFLVAGNTLFDIKKFFGCSTVAIEAARSETGSIMLGRNLDFPTLGYLNNYTLVTVYHPTGKHSWASVGFPGVIGCLSGMNDAGLTVNVLEVYSAADGSERMNLEGVPYALCYRRVLEECSTIDEAVALLRSMKRTTCTNLAVADPNGTAVLEVTTKQVVVRRAENAVCAATNHFVSDSLQTWSGCYRYKILRDLEKLPTVSLKDVRRALHEVNQGTLTLQTMIWEPATKKLHLAIGPCPTSRQPMHTLELAELFKKKPEPAANVR